MFSLENQVKVVRVDASRRSQAALTVQRRAYLVGADDAAKWSVLYELFALFPKQLSVRVEECDELAATHATSTNDARAHVYVFNLAPPVVAAFEHYCASERDRVELIASASTPPPRCTSER